jgi:transcription elongation factor GreA
MAEKIKMLPKGYEKLLADLDYLRNVKRSEISDAMGVAIADGDLRESAAYDDARMQQSANEDQIRILEDQLSRVEIVNLESNKPNVVSLGARVLVSAGGKEMELEIVGTYEVNVLNQKDGVNIRKISEQSPIGQALTNHGVGETVVVQTPKSTTEFIILKIEY